MKLTTVKKISLQDQKYLLLFYKKHYKTFAFNAYMLEDKLFEHVR